MATIDSANTSDLLSKLARLEEQISSLTLELEAKKRQTTTLEKTSSGDRNRIAELEAALIIAQKSMLDRTLDIIQTYQQEIKNNLDEKGLKPAVEYIQNLVETTQSLTNQTKELLNKNLNLLKTGFQTASEQMYQWPGQSREFLDTVVINKIKLQIGELTQLINQYTVSLARFSETKLIMPVSFFYNDAIKTAKAMPEKCKHFIQETFSGNASFSKEIPNAAKDYVISTLQDLLTIINSKVKKLNNAIKKYIDEHSSRSIDHSLNPA